MLLLSARALDLEHTDNCTADYLAICEGHDGKSEDCIRLCHPLFLPLLTFSRSPVRFHFRSDLTVQASGFLLYYSYLYELAVPTRINDTHHYLDCSTAYYPEVKEHVACNLYPDCQDGRDEMYCGTTVPVKDQRSDDVCFLSVVLRKECDGWYAFRNSCYEYVFTDGDGITWDDAQMECEEKHYGGHLVSINTPEEKAFVRSLLMQGLDNKYVHAGLSTAEDALPQLYRQMWTWADKTVGYYVSLNGSRTGRMCTMIEPKTSLMLVTVDCEDTVPADYLCEWRQSNVTNDSSWYEEIPVIEVPDDRLRDRVNFAECPLGHLTHDFLTCDSESDCGVTREMRVCSLRDGKPIIQYGCERGGRVSFTLLCDFRPDCPDGSDEEFCVPRECTDGEWKCRNKQCIREKDRCDGIFHCMDRSDEENCYICAPGFIYCHTIGCIPGPGQLERNRTLQCGAYGSVNEERRYFVSEHVSRLSPPSIVVPDGYGNFTQCKLSVSLMGHGDLDALRRLDLSFVSVVELRGAVFEDLPNLRILNLSYTVTQEKVSEYLKNALKSPEARSLLQQWVSDGVLETSDVAMALASTSDKADSDTESSRASEEIIAIVKHWAKDGLVDAEELTEALRSLSEDGQKTEEGDGKTTESDKGRANGQATNGVVKGSAMNGRCSR
ncbi:hypothetical protein BaRGS_00001144 [Batillaria attramentaria]|uniref:Uncharacterized protein n=1 Tax=Batillaria attramentaria TaxID=370345 RepID=A0ABD0M637_9CAEN